MIAVLRPVCYDTSSVIRSLTVWRSVYHLWWTYGVWFICKEGLGLPAEEAEEAWAFEGMADTLQTQLMAFKKQVV